MEKLYRNLEIKEAKKLFNISSNPDGYTITGLKSRVTKCLPSQQIRSSFVDKKDDGIIYMPDVIDGKAVCKWNMWCIPTKAIVLCGEKLWKELPKAIQTRTATYYLDHMEDFDEDQKAFIEAFIKKNMKNVSALLETNSKSNNSIVSMSKAEAEKFFDISKSHGIYNITGFKTVPTEVYSHNYEIRDVYTVVLPDMIDGVPIGKYATGEVDDKVIIMCSSEVFERLKRENRASTAYYYLSHKADFSDFQSTAIIKFIKEYTDDIINLVKGDESLEFYSELLNIAMLNQSQFEMILELNGENAEAFVMLSEYSKNHDFPVANKLSVKELKKQWSYFEVTGGLTDLHGNNYVPSDENYIKIERYKGNARTVVVPEFIGKLRVMAMVINGGAPAFWESVKIENPDIVVKTNFDKCEKMADQNGCIVIEAGDRKILAGYCGDKREIIISDGVTEMNFSTFINHQYVVPNKIVVPDGCKIFDIEPLGSKSYDSHSNKKIEIEIPPTVTKIYLTWNEKIVCTILGEAGSYAEQFAREHGVAFVKK